MKKNLKNVFLIVFSSLLILFAFSACNFGFYWGLFGEDNVDERSSSMKSLQDSIPDFSGQSLSQADNTYSFLLVTDLHFGASWGDNKKEEFLAWFSNRLESYKNTNPEKVPRFVVNLGDTADGGHRSEYSEYLDFEGRIKEIARNSIGDENYRVYSILGNHDLYNNGVSDYSSFCFPYISSYYFSIDFDASDSIPGFSFYFLDTANGTLGKSQLEDFKDKISGDSRPKIVFSHYPVYAGYGKYLLMRIQNSLERNTLLAYFSKYNVKQIYDGHIHARTDYNFEKFRENVIQSFRYGEAAICTVNEATKTVSTEFITF